MERQIIYDKVFEIHKDGNQAEFTFGEITIPLEPDDIINIEREEGYYSENNSWDDFSRLVILRGRQENDAEYNERVGKSQKHLEELKARRYENYLKLKKEFEK